MATNRMRWQYLGGRQDGCIHTKHFKTRPDALDGVTKAFTFVHASQRKPLHCMVTPGHDAWRGRLHVCLQCVFVGKKECIPAHCKQTDHYLFVDISSKHTFCSKCGDYVYDGEFERISRRARAELACQQHGSEAINSPWLPATAKDASAFAKHLERQPAISSSFTPGLGLRGLCNLGNTCFASCVIQALVHNPLLRNFFLMGRHRKSAKCRTRGLIDEIQRSGYKENDRIEARWKSTSKWYPGIIRKINENGSYEVLYDDGDTEHEVDIKMIRPRIDKEILAKAAAENKGERCLGCALATVFFEMYSGETKPFTSYKLLYAVWQNSRHLAGYSQQDAHEFFLALLDGLHMHLGGSPVGPPTLAASTIIQQIFTGALQSDVTCSACGAVSTTIDPFWDISLDVRPIAHMPTPQKTSSEFEFVDALRDSANTGDGTVKKSAVSTPAISGTCTLEDCLRRYVRTEQLSSSIYCARCCARQQATKRMSMSKLPMVVCFHLKRFEHEFEALKIDNIVRFPETLDMRPYLAGSLKSDAAGDPADAADSYTYSLFAVINHHGTMSQGHYTSYVRLAQPGEQWFLCDDEAIYMANTDEVLSSEGYMLFYIKRRLEYDSK